ncbi:MAG: hypothetical protein SF339_08310 [Blastocatellia bacterium]|nr:hypothetical protein [Blastocatellia bacterium]
MSWRTSTIGLRCKLRDHDQMNQECFDRLLGWLDPHRDRAGEKYEAIRRGLMMYFDRRDRLDADRLTDLTFDRVCQKLLSIGDSYVGEPAKYVFRVAQYILKENPLPPVLDHDPLANDPKDSLLLEIKEECRESCLAPLSTRDRTLIFEYYRAKRGEERARLAAEYGISSNALTVRVHRIRESLTRCLKDCLKKNGETM